MTDGDTQKVQLTIAKINTNKNTNKNTNIKVTAIYISVSDYWASLNNYTRTYSST
jgi:hypothetical protein